MNIFVEALETVYRLVTFQTYLDEMSRRGNGPTRSRPVAGSNDPRRGR